MCLRETARVPRPTPVERDTELSALQLRPSSGSEAAEAAAIPLASSISAPRLPASPRLTPRASMLLPSPSAPVLPALLPALPAMANGVARQPLPSPRLPLPPPPRNSPKTPASYEATSKDAASYEATGDPSEDGSARTGRCSSGTAAGDDSKSAASPMIQALRRLSSFSDSLRRYSSSGPLGRRSSAERLSVGAEWHDVSAAALGCVPRAAALVSGAGEAPISPFRGLRGLLKKRRSRERGMQSGGEAEVQASADRGSADGLVRRRWSRDRGGRGRMASAKRAGDDHDSSP